MKSIAWLLNLDEQPGNLVPSPHEGIGRLLQMKLEEAGYEVKRGVDAGNLGEFALLISADLDIKRIQQVAAYPRNRCFLIATEPLTANLLFHSQMVKERFGKIFTLLQNFVDNQTYFKIHHLITQKSPVSATEEIPFEQKKFCCMIQGNKEFYPNPGELYTERSSLAHSFTYFSDCSHKEFDIYGSGWEGYKNWRGLAGPNKTLLRNYKFTLCYENTFDQPGFITERLFNSLLSRNIPIYLGAPDILDYVPKECFIDARDFGGKEAAAHKNLWQFMQNMDAITYGQYIQAGQRYMAHHPKYKLFSVDNLVNTIMQHVPRGFS